MNNLKLPILLIVIIFLTGCKGKKKNSMKNSNIATEDNILLPKYVTLNVQTLNTSQDKTIRVKAEELKFPLSEEDRLIIL